MKDDDVKETNITWNAELAARLKTMDAARETLRRVTHEYAQANAERAFKNEQLERGRRFQSLRPLPPKNPAPNPELIKAMLPPIYDIIKQNEKATEGTSPLPRKKT